MIRPLDGCVVIQWDKDAGAQCDNIGLIMECTGFEFPCCGSKLRQFCLMSVASVRSVSCVNGYLTVDRGRIHELNSNCFMVGWFQQKLEWCLH